MNFDIFMFMNPNKRFEFINLRNQPCIKNQILRLFVAGKHADLIPTIFQSNLNYKKKIKNRGEEGEHSALSPRPTWSEIGGEKSN